MSWEKVLIKDVAKQVRGVSYKPTDVCDENSEDSFPILRATNITESGLTFSDLVFVKSKCVSENQVLKNGDIVIAASSGSKNIVGKASSFNNSKKFSFGAFCKVVRPNENINPQYLNFYFQSKNYRTKISQLSAGANINNIRNEDIDNLEIPLPPLHIQQHIANVLDKADLLRQKDQQLLQQYDELAQSIFYDKYENSVDKYKKQQLKEVCKKITDGTHQSPKFKNEGIPFLFVSNIKDDLLSYETDRFISEEEYNELYKRTPIEIGDILLTTVGSYGNPVVVKSKKKFMFQRHIAYLKVDKTKILPNFLFRQMKSHYFRKQVDSKVKGIAQKTLNLSELNKLEIIVPSIEEQKIHEDVEASLFVLKQNIANSALESKRLFESLLNKYFNN